MATRKTHRSGCRKYSQSLLILIVFSVVLAVALGFFFDRALTTPFKGYPTDIRLVEVHRGTNSATILKQLREAGVLRDDFIPLVYLKGVRRGESLKAGVYEFRGRLSAVQVIDKLVSGDVILKTVTIREGLDRFAIGEMMAAEGFGTVALWRKLTAETELIRDLDPKAESLEGYLFPDTYKLAPGTKPQTIVEQMVKNFRTHFGGELAYIATGLDLHSTVTLASIVETEAKLSNERPLVASVYLNRIRHNMPLQADPTVIYALKLEHRWDGNIRKDDLRDPSPYNTYMHRGFPPGPIANPGLASLRAAASPAESDYLYFVGRNDGSHVFSRNLAEHNRNVQIYQRNFFHRQRAAGTQ